MSHHVIAEFPCKEGMGPVFLPILVEALADTRAFEGCERIDVHIDADDPDRIILWEVWGERADHAAYVAWRKETGMEENLALVLEGGMPVFTHLAPGE